MTKPPLCTPTHCEGFPMVPRVGGRGGWGTIIWEISTQQTKKTRGVPHRGLANYIKTYLKAKEELQKLQIFHHTKT